LNIVEDLLGKEVIDDSGNLMGIIRDVTWDFGNNRVESLVVEKGRGGFSSIFGSGDKNLVLYENIHSIGDKVLVNIKFIEPEEEEEKDEFGLNRIGLGL
jgi:sporulation protein YlmC with PRC-barrel domain